MQRWSVELLVAVSLSVLSMVGASCRQNEPPARPSPQQMAASMRGGTQTTRNPEEIGQLAYGPGMRHARVENETANYEFAAKLDGTPQQNFSRFFGISAAAIPATFR